MHHYLGCWLECRNRNCGFPIRVPYSRKLTKSDTGAFSFACPVCLQVNAYERKHLRKVQFRIPDPYKSGKLVLFSAWLACAYKRCPGDLVVFTVAAADVSLAALLQLWKTWMVKIRCSHGHRFRVPHVNTWWVQEEKKLG